MLNINGVAVVSPKPYEVLLGDIDGETNRNANADVVRDRIATKRKINLEWGPLTQSEISKLLTSVSDVFFTATFIDPQLGVTKKTFYVGDRTDPDYSYVNGEIQWKGLKMNFIEK